VDIGHGLVTEGSLPPGESRTTTNSWSRLPDAGPAQTRWVEGMDVSRQGFKSPSDTNLARISAGQMGCLARWMCRLVTEWSRDFSTAKRTEVSDPGS
jgi:hypothetical protein